MEITKDDYFDIEYNSRKNVLEMKKNKRQKILRKHKIIAGVISATVVLMAINSVLIYKFFEILFTL